MLHVCWLLHACLLLSIMFVDLYVNLKYLLAELFVGALSLGLFIVPELFVVVLRLCV